MNRVSWCVTGLHTNTPRLGEEGKTSGAFLDRPEISMFLL